MPRSVGAVGKEEYGPALPDSRHWVRGAHARARVMLRWVTNFEDPPRPDAGPHRFDAGLAALVDAPSLVSVVGGLDAFGDGLWPQAQVQGIEIVRRAT